MKKIEIQVMAIKRIPSKITESYRDMEIISVVDENQKQFELVRFRRSNEITCKEGHFYEGTQKPSNYPEKYPNDILENVMPIVGFGGVAIPFDEGKESDPQDERQASILAQSDLHTVAPLLAEILIGLKLDAKDMDKNEKIIKKLLKDMARTIGQQARLELTREYLDEIEKTMYKE